MATKGLINPTKEQMIPRYMGRIRTLRAAIEKAEARGNQERVNSLREELTLKIQLLKEAQAEIQDLI